MNVLELMMRIAVQKLLSQHLHKITVFYSNLTSEVGMKSTRIFEFIYFIMTMYYIRHLDA